MCHSLWSPKELAPPSKGPCSLHPSLHPLPSPAPPPLPPECPMTSPHTRHRPCYRYLSPGGSSPRVGAVSDQLGCLEPLYETSDYNAGVHRGPSNRIPCIPSPPRTHSAAATPGQACRRTAVPSPPVPDQECTAHTAGYLVGLRRAAGIFMDKYLLFWEELSAKGCRVCLFCCPGTGD